MDEQKFKRLVDSGLTAREIAAELGVSRQRVYQIASKLGMSLARAHAIYRPRPSVVLPKARIMTGGVAVPVNHTVAGTISELLAAADLMARGWQVFQPIVRHRGHDLIAARGDCVVTIEVRSAYRKATGCLQYQKKDGRKSDIYALVVTGEPVQYDPQLPDVAP